MKKRKPPPIPSPAERGVQETVRLSNDKWKYLRATRGITHFTLLSIRRGVGGEASFYHCSFSVSNNVFDMASFASFV